MSSYPTLRINKDLQDCLAKTLAPMLVKIGARKVSESREEYKIQTVIGELFIHIHDNWVHCCFDDVAAARKHFGDHGFQCRLNPCSGKWNWHYFDVNPDVIYPKPRDWRKGHLKLLADTVWREIEDLTPEAVAKSKVILAEHHRLVEAAR